jgi:predicted regulator of Ras-like GTPase activity (Roadblock/LC7/MglB family)
LILICSSDPAPARRQQSSFNDELARQFRLAADLLETQHADPFRVGAYRRAASTVETMDESVADIYRRRGFAGLVAIPTVGRTLAVAIADLVERGHWRWLERLQGEVDPEAILATVAGIGPGLAARIHQELGIETLEELEVAAHDGRLAGVDGFGPKRVQSVVDSLAGRLWQRRWEGAAAAAGAEQPLTEELLDIDREYRGKAAASLLPTIAPRRFNPKHESWLPILHTARNDRSYTAVFSNTARAHQLGRTGDWVVIYADGPGDGQWTVVTETRGSRAGNRVVRGRAADAHRY